MVTIMRKAFFNFNGVTVRELKDILSQLPDTDENGEPYTIWIGNGNGMSNQVALVLALDKKQNGCDVLLESNTRLGENKESCNE